MRRTIGVFLVVMSALSAQTISEFALDPQKAVELPVSREVTAITMPGAITTVAGADMLIDDGRVAAVGVEEGASLRFHVTHAKGASFLLVQSLQPEATGTLTLLASNRESVCDFTRSDADSLLGENRPPAENVWLESPPPFPIAKRLFFVRPFTLFVAIALTGIASAAMPEQRRAHLELQTGGS